MSCSCGETQGISNPYNRKHQFDQIFKYFYGNKWPKDPMKIFDEWFRDAMKFKFQKPMYMCLATASKKKIPSSRIVSLKGYGKDGFLFFTDYASPKAQELDEKPGCALTFFWEVSKRQIRIEGCAVRISKEDNEKYFEELSCKKKILAMIGPQSGVVKNKLILCNRLSELEEQFLRPGAVIEKPSCWGGYIVRPETIEFMEVLTTTLQDRVRFTKHREDAKVLECMFRGEDGWVYQFLTP